MAELTRADLDRLGDRIEAKVEGLRKDVETGNSQTHARISDMREEFAAHVAAPCPDVKEHVGVYHRRSGDGNGNGRGPYMAVPADAGRATSTQIKLMVGIFAIIVGVASFLTFLKTFLGG